MALNPVSPDLQVLGAAVNSIVEGFGAFRILASRSLTDVDIGTIDARGAFHLDKAAWYSLADYLRAYSRIERDLGSSFVYSAGLTIPRTALFPAAIHDVETATRSIDVAYHMNHGRNGEALFDEKTGTMGEGIGHYHVQSAGARLLRIVCENPYPCDFDRGIVEAMAKRFEPSAKVLHDPKQACRKFGGESCTFQVEW